MPSKSNATNTPTVEREPVTARGHELLALVAASEGGKLYLTQEEGSEALAAGYISVDMSDVQGNTAAVTLTDEGTAALATNAGEGIAAVTNGTATGGAITIDDDVPMPVLGARRRGRTTGYPFDALNVGQSFHVPAKDGDDDVVARLASSISTARAKYAVATGENETVSVKTYAKGPDGKFVKDADGKRVVESEENVERPKMAVTRDFFAVKVDATDPKGAGARVFRSK